jgi:hypothetical protein
MLTAWVDENVPCTERFELEKLCAELVTDTRTSSYMSHFDLYRMCQKPSCKT